MFVALHPHFPLWYREHVSIAGSHLRRAAVIIIFILLSPHYGQISLLVCACDQLLFLYFHFAKADCCIHCTHSQWPETSRQDEKKNTKHSAGEQASERVCTQKYWPTAIICSTLNKRIPAAAQSLPLDSVWERRKTRGESSLAVIMYFKTLGVFSLSALHAGFAKCIFHYVLSIMGS